MTPVQHAPNPHHAQNLGSSHGPRKTVETVRLVLFPGEYVQNYALRDGGTLPVTMGHLYVVNGGGEAYSVAAGPPPGAGYADKGGHTAGETPTGRYTLGPREHHSTQNWPYSVVPWGAELQLKDGEVQYKSDGRWLTATGPHGTVTQAQHLFNVRSKVPDSPDMVEGVRQIFIDPATRALRFTTWELNDFGNWAWNLKQDGHRTAYYLHTTPMNEHAYRDHKSSILVNSHGCVHMLPADRDDMMAKGYLKTGTPFWVMPYGTKGPPTSK